MGIDKESILCHNKAMPYNWDAPIEIRDARNGQWFWVHRHVWNDARLTASDKVLYGTFAYFANGKDQQAFPSITTLAKESQLSKMQVTRSQKKLEQFKYISIKRHTGKVNRYTLLKTLPVQKLDQSQNVTSNKYYHRVVTNQDGTSNNSGHEQELSNDNYLTNSENLKKIDEMKRQLHEKLSMYKRN